MVSFGGILDNILDPFTGKSRMKAQEEVLDLQLDALKEELQFSQAFGGVQMDKPFKDIEKTRAAAKKNIRAATPSLLTTALNFGVLGLGKLL